MTYKKDKEFIKEFEKTLKESSITSLKLMRDFINKEIKRKKRGDTNVYGR